MVNINLQVDDYTNRVLGVIKEKFGFKDKSKALMYFAKLYGKDFIEYEVKDEYIDYLKNIEQNHMEKYGLRKKTIEDLRKETQID